MRADGKQTETEFEERFNSHEDSQFMINSFNINGASIYLDFSSDASDYHALLCTENTPDATKITGCLQLFPSCLIRYSPLGL